ncbi:hypothetical protein C3941_08305 [Kaistia algarum]|uniref:hypothetical protein n=1 Tax=Kaistia algarum TaxID=2083279 RepID=UPI000CE8B788|nr:hypothetical protein [Kaistia algarum]MCX5512056.1 hypothetical protein [Kaistia algarum]PPE80177.1 hypothetical protein C3941_08305 [Kaistia algarum]
MKSSLLKLLAVTALVAMGASAASARGGSTYDGYSQLLPDWQVFGFDLTSIPNDVPSLMAFKASLDPRTQLAVNNRCSQDIIVQPWRYSSKVRRFCFGR